MGKQTVPWAICCPCWRPYRCPDPGVEPERAATDKQSHPPNLQVGLATGDSFVGPSHQGNCRMGKVRLKFRGERCPSRLPEPPSVFTSLTLLPPAKAWRLRQGADALAHATVSKGEGLRTSPCDSFCIERGRGCGCRRPKAPVFPPVRAQRPNRPCAAKESCRPMQDQVYNEGCSEAAFSCGCLQLCIERKSTK